MTIKERHFTAVIEIVSVDVEFEETNEYDLRVRQPVTRRHKVGEKGKQQIAHIVVRAETLDDLKVKVGKHVELV